MPYADAEVARAYHAAYKREWSRRNRDRIADSDRARNANRRAVIENVPGRLTIEDVRSVKPPGARCAYCETTERIGIDHIIPMSRGGANTRENIQPCCHSCNSSKACADRPGRWSATRDSCLGCGTSARRHLARGLCNACYLDPKKRAEGRT